MSRTALVHPDTAKLTPEEQKKGTYHFTPPEVLAYRAGYDLNDADMEIVSNFYGGNIPTPAQAMGYAESVGQAALAEVNTVSQPRKLVKKKAPAPALDVVGAVRTLVASLSDEQTWPILVDIAKRHNLEIE